MPFHARRSPTVCAAQRPCWHATPNVVRPLVLSKGNNGIYYPMSFDRVCYTREMIACPPDVIHLCVQYKFDDGMPRRHRLTMCVFQRAMMELNARRR